MDSPYVEVAQPRGRREQSAGAAQSSQRRWFKLRRPPLAVAQFDTRAKNSEALAWATQAYGEHAGELRDNWSVYCDEIHNVVERSPGSCRLPVENQRRLDNNRVRCRLQTMKTTTRMKTASRFAATLVLALLGSTSRAALVDVGNGLINHPAANLTWVADANLFLTMALPTPPS
jgi:hypothetical protein